jgi:hypothetical protein
MSPACLGRFFGERVSRPKDLSAPPVIPFVSYAYTLLVRRKKLSTLFSMRYAHLKPKIGGWVWVA